MSNLAVKHDQQHGMFYIKLNGGAAKLHYNSNSTMDVMDIIATHVPEKAQDLGIANVLVRHTLNYARAHQMKVLPSCSFVKDFMAENKI